MLFRSILFLVFAFLFTGCIQRENSAPIRIGGLLVERDEFERAFKLSPQSRENTPAARKEFLENFINTKAVLLAACQAGLDRNKAYLDDVKFFSEQALIKMMIEQKMIQLRKEISVSAGEIAVYYEENRPTKYASRSLEEAAAEIRMLLLREKQSNALKLWVASLRETAAVRIDEAALGL